jgi:hypothetical protein
MKKTALVLGGILSLGLVATTFAQTTTNVYSKNAVGYVNLSLPKGFTPVAVPLTDSTVPLTVTKVFGTTIPDGTSLYFYNSTLQKYRTITYSVPDGGWIDDETGDPAANTELPRNQGLWVNLPDMGEDVKLNVSIVGEVPSAQNAATTEVSVANGFALICYPYPTSTLFTNTTLSIGAVDGDSIYAWKTGGGYASGTYSPSDGGWIDDETGEPLGLMLQPGRSYWYRASAVRVAAETKPYNWP